MEKKLAKKSEKKRVNCFQCIYFAVTWDTKFPRTCKYFGFKTKELPSIAVERDAGEPCLAFKPKETKK